MEFINGQLSACQNDYAEDNAQNATLEEELASNGFTREKRREIYTRYTN
ncbi:MAG: hypothetical protein Q9M91_01480 [Candidatus Dojkabacteria bacterium]|nr:hypothetical protein [Candidatus Dojkabacteria bacterium]MDQ7020496.1 hypothetical protein [Candidatus Dojkabacteria bacterium]